MVLIADIGNYGSGKTLTMTTMGYLAHLQRIPIYTNYEVSFPHTRIESIEDLDNISNGLALLDEFWYTLDSRASNTKVNRTISVIISKSRKRNLDIITTEQDLSLLDLRLRERLHYVWLPRLYLDNNGLPAVAKVLILKRNFLGNWEPLPRSLVLDVSSALDKYDTAEELMPLISESASK